MNDRGRNEMRTLGAFAGAVLGGIVVLALLYLAGVLVDLNFRVWGGILGG